MKKKLITLALLVLCALMVLCSCGDKKGTDDEQGGVIESNKPLLNGENPLVVVVRPDNSSELERQVAMDIKESLSNILGKTVQITVDWGFDAAKYPEGTYFVSVGNTSIPETQEFIATQSGETCGIKIQNQVISLATTNDMYLSILAEKLMQAITTFDSMVYLDIAKVEYDSGKIVTTTIINDKKSDYSIVYENTKGLSEYPEEIANDLCNAIKEAFGVKLALNTDNNSSSGKEIILGVCPRIDETANIAKDLRYNEYAINVEEDGTIYITGKNYETTLRGINAFIEMANAQKKSGEFRIATVLSGKKTIENMPDVPLYENSTDFELISSVLDSSMMYYQNATVDGYNNYLTQLEAAGYDFVVKNEIKGNIFATYQNKEAVINCYYTKHSETVRVCIDSKEYTEVHNFEPKSVEAITTPMLIQYTSGCGFLLRLEDGTFVIYDAGMSNDIYKNLNACLQKYNVTGSKPIVRAWMYSHPHVDHVGGFFKFCENYANTISVLQFVYNNPTRTHYHYTIDDPPNGDVILEDRINKFLDYCEKYYPSADVVVGHTGQIMYFGNTKAEILHTHEDDYPEHLKAGNQISMLVRFTFKDQTILFTGDMHQTSNPIIVKMFGDHLKSNMVQMAHHGYNGGSADFYRTVGADVCLFTNGYAKFLEVCNRAENQLAIKMAKQVLVPTDDNDIIAYELPYQLSYGQKWNRK